MLLLLVACGSSSSGADGGGNGLPTSGPRCTGASATECASVPYGACVAVQQAPGFCVDWSTLGATPCPHGPSDCPAALPAPDVFATGTPGTDVACVTTSGLEFGDGKDAGYCASFAYARVPGGVVRCNPNPCRRGGYCSGIVNANGEAVMECLDPI